MAEQRIILPYPSEADDHAPDINDLGYQADMNMIRRSLVDRRRVLGLGFAGIGLLLAGCGSTLATGSSTSGTSSGGTSSGGTSTGATSSASCASATPSETAGPYPADGSSASSQSLNVRTISGIDRTNLLTSAGTGNSTSGVPLSLTMTLVNVKASCAALSGYAIYVWHCTADGNYSLYSSGLTSEDYLRGIATTDGAGQVTFTTLFPGCYAGRWPHIHFEVFPSLAIANSAASSTLTSQLAMPEANCRAVYTDSRYGNSLNNLNQISLSTDNVFSDGYTTQLATVSGSNSAGYSAAITVGISV